MTSLTRPDGSLPEDLAISRRAIASLFFGGYALAGASALADPIHTDDTGLITTDVAIPNGSTAPLPAYIARPSASGRHPVIMVVSEVFGIHEYIRDTCRRLAKLGYVAIAPAFFYRAGDPAPLTDFPAIMKIVATATNAQVMADIGATLAWLKSQSFVQKGKSAITGFCWGGGVTWMACAAFKDFAAGVAWYGRVAGPPTPSPTDPDRQYPLQITKALKAPVLGLYAGQDQGIPLTDVEAMRTALKDAAVAGSDIIVYPQAKHGFHADYRASYDAVAAADGWSRMLAHFRANGVG